HRFWTLYPLEIHPTPVEGNASSPTPSPCRREITGRSYEYPVSFLCYRVERYAVDQRHNWRAIGSYTNIKPISPYADHSHRTLRRVRALRIGTIDPSNRGRALVWRLNSYASWRLFLHIGRFICGIARKACNRKHAGE